MSETIPDVPPQEVWQALKSDPKAKLVDVRTTAEWNFVGVPDLKELGKAPVKIEWQVYPSMSVNSDFLHKMKLEEVQPGDKVYFLCRSGVRSLAAAKLAKENGYGQVFNITDGFEGPKDADGHRGTVAGWKQSGLPWSQG